jgi:hypothetical protein
MTEPKDSKNSMEEVGQIEIPTSMIVAGLQERAQTYPDLRLHLEVVAHKCRGDILQQKLVEQKLVEQKQKKTS